MYRDEKDNDEEDILEEDEDIYTEGGREELVDEDELTDVDEGFMQGYEEGEKIAKCAYCKKVIDAKFVETEIGGEIYRFCSEDHAEKFKRKLEKL